MKGTNISNAGKVQFITSSIVWIFVGALVIRLLVVYLTHGHWFNTDSYAYIKQAEAIISGQPFGYFPNGYPFIIALAKITAGESLCIYFLLLLNVLLSSSSVILCYLIGRKIFDEKTGVIIAVVLMFYPNQLNYVREIMSEVPAEFFLVAGLYAFLRRRYFISAILLLVTSYIRTEFIPVALILGLILILRDKTWMNVYKYAAGVIVVILVVAVIRYEGVVEPPANLGKNLLIAVNTNSQEGLTFSTNRYSKDQIAHPITTYLSFVGSHPSKFISQRLWSFWEFWGPWPGDGNDPSARRSTLAKCIIGTRFFFLILALFSIFLYWHRWEPWVLLMPVLVITTVHFLFYSTPRYEYVIEPLVIILAMGGLKVLYGKFNKNSLLHRELRRPQRATEIS